MGRQGNVGKRYRAQDEAGTPYCITVDFESLETEDVTVRDRDTMKQERVKIKELKITYMKNIKRIKLRNGLRIILAPQPGSLAATVMVSVEAGSKYETKDIKRHLAFSGAYVLQRYGKAAEAD